MQQITSSSQPVYRAYTGIGSREAPAEFLALMRELARALATQGWTLRSGGANGADTAFAAGSPPAQAEIFLPWHGFNDAVGLDASRLAAFPAALELAATLHPAWGNLKRGARALMARNCMQVLGASLQSPSRFVLCWAPNPQRDGAGQVCNVAGGTGQAVRLAHARGIPVFHLGLTEHRERVCAWLERGIGAHARP